jgi:hypothetical protein
MKVVAAAVLFECTCLQCITESHDQSAAMQIPHCIASHDIHCTMQCMAYHIMISHVRHVSHCHLLGLRGLIAHLQICSKHTIDPKISEYALDGDILELVTLSYWTIPLLEVFVLKLSFPERRYRQSLLS